MDGKYIVLKNGYNVSPKPENYKEALERLRIWQARHTKDIIIMKAAKE